MFETNACPDSWIDNLNSADIVFNPSTFGVNSFRNSGVKDVEYLPFPINTDLFSSKTKKIVQADEYKFMAFVDLQARKNISGLLEAFLTSFRNRKDVCLILKLSLVKSGIVDDFKKDFQALRRKFGCSNYPKVYLYPALINGEAIPGFVNSCDCLVSPSCGEEFGFPALYAMACEKPVISIDWSSCVDYINQETALPLTYKIDSVPYSIVKQDANFYGHQWAYPSVEHLSLLMEWVINHPEECKEKGKKARELVMEKYSLNKVTEIAKNILKERGYGSWFTI
jgi:glycosyltransferase involved in cell wall biosynthesis